MTDDELSEGRPDRPVLAGLIALAGVGLVVGLVLGGVALAGAKVLGLGGGGGGSGESSSQQSFYLPEPEETEGPDGPLITLAPDPEASEGAAESSQPSEPTSSPTEEEDEIALSAGQTAVSPMGQIDLTGVYPGGEGAILQVQRFTDGQWLDFPVTASVSNETFTTYVQTGQVGVNRFRVVDTDGGLTSNEVRVRVG